MFAAIVKVISLKCVQHKTKPKNVTTCKIINVKTPLFQAISCSNSNEFIYNFLNKWIQENINNRSTPRSCIQKKSSVYKSSISSSSRTIGTIIASGTKLNDSIVPLINWDITTKIIKKPNNECISWNATVKVEKYFIKFKMFKLK